MINYLFPQSIDKLEPALDPLVSEYGIGPKHADADIVERLISLQLTESGIVVVDAAPIQLELRDDGEARNWEGLVRFDEADGFLLVTDKFPTTLLGFVKGP